MNLKKTVVLIFVISVIFQLSLFAGGRQEVSSAAEVPAETPELRVVSLAPNITEIIFALGKGGSLVGRTDWCNYPAEVAAVASVGSLQEPSAEAIIELEPDVVIASTHAPKDVADMLIGAGINVKYYYAPDQFEGVYNVIKAVGADLGAEAEAAKIVADMNSRFDIIKMNAASVQVRPTVYYVVGFGEGGDWTAGGDTFIGQMIELAGGDNIAAEISGWSFSLEKIVEADPEIIIVSESLKDVFIETPIYSDLTAVVKGRVYGVNDDIVTRQGPRLIEGIELLNAAFTD